MIEKIVSGGQTGADRAALDVALAVGLNIGGWVPLGRAAEDGRIPDRYANLEEASSADPAVRTELNVRDSDATLILSHGPLTGGSALTAELCQRHERPMLHVDLSKCDATETCDEIRSWLTEVTPGVLNVAGPRQGEDPAIYQATRAILGSLLGLKVGIV